MTKYPAIANATSVMHKVDTFGAVDFVIFIGLFALSTTVGAIFAYRDRKQQTTDNYYFGGRAVSPVLVAISIAVSFVSALTVIGFPTEVYYHGLVSAWYMVGFYITSAMAVLYYVPLFHRLQISSVYQYLEMRFHRYVRIAASLLGICSTTSFLAIAIYIPALALNAVTPLELTWTILLTSAVCTFYTAIGGIKAVLWADALQCVVMVAGVISVLGAALWSIGGFEVMRRTTADGGRNNILKFNMDPTVRSSATTCMAGGATIASYEILCNQIYIQRWLSCKSVANSRKAVLLSIVPVSLFGFMAMITGLVLFSYYEGCDPLHAGVINKPDQLMPLLAIQVSRDLPGMAGLFVAAAFCGTMSTVSSGLNSLSAVFLIDFCLPHLPNLSNKKQMILSKVLTVVFGALVMTIAYIVSIPSTNVVGITIAVYGFFAGPVVGVFTMGLFMPWIDSLCVSIGFAFGMLGVGLFAIAGMVTSQSASELPTSMENCFQGASNHSFTTSEPITYTITGTIEDLQSSSALQSLGSLSPYLYGLLGIVCSIFGANVSWLVFGGTDLQKFDGRFFTPLCDGPWLSVKGRRFFRCGVLEHVDEKVVSDTNGVADERVAKL